METKRGVGFGDTNRSGVVMLCICTLLSLSLSLQLTPSQIQTAIIAMCSCCQVFIQIPRETPFMCKPVCSSSSAPDAIPGVSCVFRPHQ
ncbi:unnamed protein product, partial [Musa acuminata var. zebrina]